MADVAQKAISANNVRLGSVTVKNTGSSKYFTHDYETAQTNPDGSSAAYWEARLQDRFDEPRYYEGDTPA